MHHSHVGDISKPDGTVKIATCNGKSVEIPSPSMVCYFVSVQEVHITESVAAGFHCAEKTIVNVFFNIVCRRNIGCCAQNVSAEFHPRNAYARFHHAFYFRVSLFLGSVVPCLARPLGIVRFVSPSVSHNGYFVLFYIAKIVFETGFPLFFARHPVIFNKSVKHGVHFVGFWIAARHFVGRDILKSLGKDVGIAASASVYDVFGEIKIAFVAGYFV